MRPPRKLDHSNTGKFYLLRHHVRTMTLYGKKHIEGVKMDSTGKRMEPGATNGTWLCNSLILHDMKCHFLHHLFVIYDV